MMGPAELKFIYSKAFRAKWKKAGLEDEDYLDLETVISNYVQKTPDNTSGQPFPGNIIKNSGGAIKLRYAPQMENKGKSGSLRIIYFVYMENSLFFLDVYSKNQKENLTDKEKKDIKNTIRDMKSSKNN